MSPELTLKELLGKTITSCEGASVGSTEVIFDTKDGKRFRMYHQQDCCEGVDIEKVTGRVEHILKSPVLSALESTSHDEPPDAEPSEYTRESATWTEFTISTKKGSFKIRWLGESNGYYSESVDFVEIK